MFHKARSKYIYFKNFMVRKRDVAISVAVLLFVIFGGIYLYVANYQSSEERELVAMMEGKTKDMGGVVQSVDYNENEFVLRTMRPTGEYKEYTIHVDRKTDFSFQTEEMVEVFTDEFEGQIFVEYEQKVEESPASFGDVKEGGGVLVVYRERVDLDSELRLVAGTVKITKQINNINEKEEFEEEYYEEENL